MSAPAQQPATALVPGRDFPRNYAELRAWFPDDGACVDYLEWLRWPEGFVCPRCGGDGSRLADGRHWCEPCHRRVSVTTGTVFHRTRTPLTVWFAVAWYMTSTKNGVAALTLHRLLGFGETTFRPTSTNSRSASTGESRSSGGSSSAGSWNSAFRLDRSRTARWWSIPYQKASSLCPQEAATGLGPPPSQ